MKLDTSQFTESENLYRHPLVRSVFYTDGVKYVGETAGAYWLIDKIATVGPTIKEDFQVWKLVIDQNKATLRTEDGDDHLICAEVIHYTDFPEPGIDLWFTNNTILLPSEY